MFGLYVTAANIILTLIMFFTGTWKSTPWLAYLSLIFMVIGIVMAIKDRRDVENGGEIRFGQAFSTGFTVVLVAAITGTIFFFVYSSYINPESATYMKEQMEQGMAEQQKQMTEAEFEQAKEFSGMMANPATMAITQFLMSLLLGSVLTAIIAAFLKKEPRPMVMS